MGRLREDVVLGYMESCAEYTEGGHMVEGGAGYPIPMPQGIGRVLGWWLLGKELNGVLIP